MLRIRGVPLNGVKNVEKSAKKIWKFRFFAVTLHPLSHRKMVFESDRKRVLKNFLKKVSEKFGGYKKTLYLCTTFALIKQPRCKNRKREPQGLIR